MNSRTTAMALAVTTIAASLTFAASPPAQAGILCDAVNICGHAKDSGYSNAKLLVRCDHDNLFYWVSVNHWSACHDVNFFYARRGFDTRQWSSTAQRWIRLPNGKYNVRDGQWDKVWVRR